MTHRLFHIGIRPDGPLDQARLEKAFDLAGQWLRLNDFNCYVWTADRAVHLNESIRPLVGPHGSVVILQIDTSAGSERWAPPQRPYGSGSTTSGKSSSVKLSCGAASGWDKAADRAQGFEAACSSSRPSAADPISFFLRDGTPRIEALDMPALGACRRVDDGIDEGRLA